MNTKNPPQPKRGPGQPRAFSSIESLQEGIDAYFALCKGKARKHWSKVPSKVGLSVSLGVVKSTLWEYESGKHGIEYSNAIKKAYSVIENAVVDQLYRPYPTGAIFYLKNAFKEDYRDRYDHTTDGKELPAPQIIVYGAQDRLAKVMERRKKA